MRRAPARSISGVLTTMALPSPKFMLPQSSVQISGRSSSTWASLVRGPTMSVPASSNAIGSSPGPKVRSPPMPAVKLMTASTSAERMRSTTSRYRATSRAPLPVAGSRTWQCTIAAPARAASIAASAISLGVTGIAGCRPTVSPAPVTAQVMKTSQFMPLVLSRSRRFRFHLRRYESSGFGRCDMVLRPCAAGTQCQQADARFGDGQSWQMA